MFSTNFKTVIEIVTTFSTQEKCIQYLEQMRWEDGVVSPFDKTSKVYACKGGKYRCKNTGKYFNVKTDTMFDNTKIELQKWFLAIYLVTSHKKGISSLQLARDINVTQKSAWFMLQRIRSCFKVENYNELEGIVEFDETYYGGKNKNRHADKKSKQIKVDKDWSDKVPITGMIQRGGKMTAIALPNTQKDTLQPILKKYIKQGTITIADDYRSYKGLETYFEHKTVKNTQNNYLNLYDPSIHSNQIEGSWKIMKNSLRDMYNHVSRKHIQLYVDEFVYRYNMRKSPESDKFNWLLFNSNVRTKYLNLIND